MTVVDDESVKIWLTNGHGLMSVIIQTLAWKQWSINAKTPLRYPVPGLDAKRISRN